MASHAERPFSLRPTPTASRKPKNLAEFIARVNARHDGFRNLREDDLRREIELQKTVPADVDMEDDSEEGEDAGGIKDIRAARDDILKNIEIAHRNAMLTLDFISLLLSKETPVQAGLTLSPELREMVGIGTLGASNLAASNLTQARVQENKMVAMGRKLLDINKTADSVLSAAARLQQEISLETKYWADVLAVSDGGWSVLPLPQEQNTMGVKFGFSEGIDFRVNTVAPMRRAHNGSAELDVEKAGARSKRFQVSIESRGKVVGRSSVKPHVADDARLESRVLEARDSIFARELWHEINREGRTLLSYDVRLETSSVTYALDSNTSVKFRLLDFGDADGHVAAVDSHAEDGNAEMISAALSLLLSYGHRQNARKRSQQTLLSGVQGRGQNQPQLLLRPILAYLQHEHWIRRCTGFFSDIVNILQAAGIETAAYTISEQPLVPLSSGPASESLVGALLSPLVFRAELTITREARLEVVSHTFASQHIIGSFRIGLLQPLAAGKADENQADDVLTDSTANPLLAVFPPSDSYPDLREVLFYICEAVPRALACRYEALAQERTVGSVGEDEPPRWVTSINGKAVVDRETEKRGVHFGLLPRDGDDTEVELKPASAKDHGRSHELWMVGNRVVGGKPVRTILTWSADKQDGQTGVDEAVRDIILGQAQPI